MKLGRLTKIRISPNEERTKLSFAMTFDAQPRQVEFEVPSGHAMALMQALQSLQVRHKLPMPKPTRTAGKPVLRLVTDDE
jgi:hypothetical protein